MKLFGKIHMLLIIYLIMIFLHPVLAQEKLDEKPWVGTLADGRRVYEDDLLKILEKHEHWLLHRWDETSRANLEGAYLEGVNLEGANLEGAKFKGANLKGANLKWIVLRKADLEGANLEGANLEEANLEFAYLEYASMERAVLKSANLEGAVLKDAVLKWANLESAKLNDAFMKGATLQHAYSLLAADMQGAFLEDANLKGVDMTLVNLKHATFELKPGALPDILTMIYTDSLPLLNYTGTPHSLIELRKAFKEAGLRKEEREVTYAIKHSGFENALLRGDLLTKIEVILGWIFFELTCKWGMTPERPLFILVGLIFFFTIPYAQAISTNIFSNKKKDGIWKVWIPERMRDDKGKKKPKLLLDSLDAAFCFKMGFYFSVLSAFNIGWRELNVGNWISRIQPYEYKLQATGWARTFSGIQSIISVYLLALSVLTYFGRPFESY